MTDTAFPWLANYDPKVPAHVPYREEPLTGILDRAVQRTPERTAVTFQNWSIRYDALREQAGRFAAGLRRMGVVPGDRVAIMLPNLPQTIIAYWGTLYAGATVVFVNPLYMETELTHILEDSGARVLLTLDLLWNKHRPLLEASGLTRMIITRINDGLAFPLNWLYRLRAWKEGKYPTFRPDGERTFSWNQAFGSQTLFHTDFDPATHLAL